MSYYPGVGVMIGMLGGTEDSVAAYQRAVGKTIESVALVDDVLRFTFTDGYVLRVSDEGQSCCESRYMVTDDDLSYYAGAVLNGMEIRTSADLPDHDCAHEVQFLDVNTSKGTFQMCTHNEHNGYYGGFWIVCRGEGS